MKKLLIVGALLVGYGIARAQTGTFMVYGPLKSDDFVSCGQWTISFPGEKKAYDWWLLGFVSGAGYGLKNNGQLARTDSAGLEGWVEKYCADHPLDPLPKAAVSLVEELKARAAQRN